MLTSLISLSVTAVFLFYHEQDAGRKHLLRELNTLANIMANNSVAALAFHDRGDAHDLLGHIRGSVQILYAEIQDIQGNHFAHYAFEYGRYAHQPPIITLARNDTVFGDHYLEIYRAISLKGNIVGYIYLRASYDYINAELKSFALFMPWVCLLSLLIAFIFSTQLQAIISTPLVNMLQVMKQVSRTKNYSIRVEKQGQDDELQHIILGFNDMLAKIQQHDKELKIAKIQADEANVAKSRFLATMSHEIRTPMNGVLGMTEILLDSGLSDKQIRLAETIMSSGTNLLDIINDILDFSKIEAGKMDLNETDINIYELVEEIVELFAGSASQKGLELSILMVNPLPEVLQGDPVRLRQILSNLINNALKFTAEGSILVRLRIIEQYPKQNELSLLFEVQDSGIGLDQETIDRLFSPFTQADASVTRKYGGTGLGLAISKQLSELMGGEIGCHSELGQGATFFFSAKLKTHSEVTTPEFTRANFSQQQLILLDPDTHQGEVLSHYLKSWQSQVKQVADTSALLSALQKNSYHAVFFDPRHVDKQLGDFLTTCQATGNNAQIQLVQLTSLEQEQSQSDLSFSHAHLHLLRKPVTQSNLHAYMHSLTTDKWSEFAKLKTHNQANQIKKSETKKFNAHILLVEDNPVNQKVSKLMLTKLGCDVEIANDGIHALEILQNRHFDLIFMDCQMPRMDGFTATEEIRKRETTYALQRHPIIALTANAMEGDKEQCLVVGMDDYLSKPFTKNKLYTILDKYLTV